MTHTTVGRHRAPRRFSPLAELSAVVSGAVVPAVRTTGLVAASGGLVAAFALPAHADPAVDHASGASAAAAGAQSFDRLVATATAGAPALPEVSAPAVTAPATPAPVASDVGRLAVSAVAKPKPKPTPAPEPPARRPAGEQAAQARSAQAAMSSRSSTRSAPAPAPAPAPKPKAAASSSGGVLGAAASLVGIGYVYGGTTPAGFDCSGYTAYVFNKVGVSLPRTAEQQRRATTPVSDPQPGDLVFFGAPAYHVGIYAGNGKMWDSPRAGEAVSLRPVFGGVSGYGRP